MAQLSSEEALNGIFNILDTMVSLQQAEKNKTPETKADETIISLLTGVVEGAKDNAIGSAGEQLEKLAKGLHALSDLNEESMKTISSTIGAINNLTKLDLGKLNSMMDEFNPNAGKKIGKFVTNIYDSIKDANLSDKEIKLLILPIGTLLKGLSEIVDTNVFKMKLSLNPFKGKMLGKQLGDFINAFAKAAGDAKIDSSMKNISALLDPLAKFADSNSKISIFKFIKVFNKVNANLIGNFFKTIVESVPSDKEVSKTVYAITELFKVLFNIDPNKAKAFSKAVNYLDKDKAIKLNNFINELCNGDWDINKLKAVDEFMNNAAKTLLLVVAALSIVIVVSKLTSLGDAIIGFGLLVGTVITIKHVVKSIITDLNNKDVSKASIIVKEIGFTIGLLLGVMSVVAIITKFIGLVPIITAFVIMKFTISSVKNLIIAISDKEIKDGLSLSLQVLYGVSALLISMSVSMMIVTLTSRYNSLEDIAIGFLIISLFTAGIIVAIKQLSNIKDSQLEGTTNALLKISAVFAIISLVSATLLIPIGKKSGDVLMGGGLIMTIIGLSIGAVFLISKIKGNDLDNSINALLSITAVFSILSLVSLTLLIPIGKKYDDVLKGAGVIFTIIAISIAAVTALSFIKNDATQATKILIALTGVFTVLSIVSLTLLIPIGKKADDIMLGALVITFIMAALIGGVYLLSKFDTKNIVKALAVTVILSVIYIGIALITKDILIPIGKQTKEAGLGAGVTLLIIGALILGTWALSKIDTDNILKALAVTAVLAFILLGVSLITKEILIPIGKESEAALYGAGIIVGIIGAMGVIMFAIGKLTLRKEVLGALIRGGITMAGIAAVLLITGYATRIFAKNAKEIWELNSGGDVLLGGALMLGILGSMGAIMYFVGDKLAKPAILKSIAIGGALMTGVGILMGLIGASVGVFAKNAALVSLLNKQGDLLGGAGLIVLLLGAFTVIFGVVGSLTAILPLIITGAATMTIVSGAIFIIASVMGVFISLLLRVMKFDKDLITLQGDILVTIFDVIFKVIKKAAPNPLLLLLAAAATAFIIPVTGVFGLLTLISNMILSINKKLTVDMINTFYELMIGKEGNEKNSLLGSIEEIVKRFSLIDGAVWAAVISVVLRPVIETISLWIDIVLKVATMSYVTGFDDNGKPKYEKLPPSTFADASTVITNGFKEFLTGLQTGFDLLKTTSVLFMTIASKLLRPVIDLVSLFVDVVMKVATCTYVSGYDENGKPTYTKVDPNIFGLAATLVSDRFSEFLGKLNEGFNKLSVKSIIAMEVMKDVMKPVMECVKDFVDTVIKVATMTVITGYDKDGHPEYELIDLERFLTAGVYVSETFGLFMTNLAESFNKLDYKAVYAMNAIKDSIAPLMDGVSSFVDAILKLSTGQYVDGYTETEKGNLIPSFKKVTEVEYTVAAVTVATMFALFVDKLTDSFLGDFWGSKTEDALEAIGGSIAPVMEGVGSYVEAILLVATGVYVEKYEKDKDGKYVPVYKHLTNGMFVNAAVAILRMFLTFITALTNKLNEPGFIKKVEDASDAITNSIVPVMSAVKDFSDSLKPFLGLTTTGLDKNGKPKLARPEDYICLQPGKAKLIAKNIADAFTTFIGTIANNFVANEDKYSDIEDTADTVKKVLASIKATTDNLVKIISSMTDDNGKVKDGVGVVNNLTGVLDLLINYFSSKTSNLEPALLSANSCKTFISGVKNISTVYKQILNNITEKEDSKSSSALIDNFTGNLDKLVNKFVSYSNTLNGINMGSIYNMMNIYSLVASLLVRTTDFINLHESMELGIIKFVTNLNRLTSPLFTRQLNNSTGNIRLYTVRLHEFTDLIISTTGKVEVYTTSLEKARKALKALDDEIINKEKKRNHALETFANKVNDIADAVYNLLGAFNALDENAIINRFQGVKDLIDTVLGNDNNNTTNTGNKANNTSNKTNTNTNNRNNNTNNQANQRNNTRYVNQGIPTSGMVTFEFKDTVLRGFYHTN